MSATIDHAVAANDAAEGTPVDTGEKTQLFHFRLNADMNGINELTFVKNPALVFATLLSTLKFVNETFDTPFPTTQDFIKMLGDVCTQYEAIKLENPNDDKDDAEPATK